MRGKVYFILKKIKMKRLYKINKHLMNFKDKEKISSTNEIKKKISIV